MEYFRGTFLKKILISGKNSIIMDVQRVNLKALFGEKLHYSQLYYRKTTITVRLANLDLPLYCIQSNSIIIEFIIMDFFFEKEPLNSLDAHPL